MEHAGRAAAAAGTAIVIALDEIQYLDEREFSALIMAMHRVSQRQLPVVLLATGLPQVAGLAGAAKSYAERLFTFPRLGALSPEDTRVADLTISRFAKGTAGRTRRPERKKKTQ
jgi:hypothetical protein